MLPKSLDTLRIDINSGKVRKAVSICQNDTVQRTLNFQLVDSGSALDIDNVLFAEILIHKADGYEADNGCVIDGDSIQYTLRSTDIAALGTNLAQLQLTFKDGQVLTTPTFEINVYSKILDQRVQQSMNEYTALTQQLVLVNEMKDQTETAKNTAVAAASEASGYASTAETYDATYQSLVSEANDYANSASVYQSMASEYASTASTAASEAASEAASTAASETADNFESLFASLTSEASEYANSASTYEASASTYASETASKHSQTANYMASTSDYLTSASEYASTADSQASAGSTYMTSTSEYMASASSYASAAASQATAGSNYLASTSEYASEAGSDASVANSCADAAEYYYNQTESIAETIAGGIIPKGTVAFANLPALADAMTGWMYNILDQFETTSDFEEGSGYTIPSGSNVYKTAQGKWDILAGSPVSGVKGDNEQYYRFGNVNITKGNIGLGNVRNEDVGSDDISAVGANIKAAILALDTRVADIESKLGYPINPS